jgi:tetratricopeptide (TPR) repeat protein
VMLFSGHYDKAEVLFREQLAQHRLHYMAHEDIGYSLLRQGRYDEAVRCFQAVITAAPENAYAYAGLAETYLELGQNPVYALDLTVTAARLKDENWLARIMARHHWANIYGTQAWAYAQLGERVEAENAIQLGLMKTNRHFKPGVAGLYYRAGRAMQALADIAKAREYWQLGYQLDSMGGYGNLAGEALVALEAQQASISAVSR